MSSPGVRGAAVRRLGGLLAGSADAFPPTDRGGWDALLDLAAVHGLLPALYVAVRDRAEWPGVTASVLASIEPQLKAGTTLPELVLLRAYERNSRRNARLLEAGLAVLEQFDAEQLPALPLKGLHTLIVGLWPDPGTRTMVDLDVLVRPEHATQAFELLRSADFEELPGALPDAHRHLPALRRGDTTVELHTEALGARWRSLLTAEMIWANADYRVNGPVRWEMSDTDAVAVLVAHAQLEDDAYRFFEFPLRALYETRQWLESKRAGIDWDEIARRFRGVRRQGAVEAHLLAARRFFGIESPRPVPGLRARTHEQLAVLQFGNFLRYLQRLPHSFSTARMGELYGPVRGPGWLWRSRARHVSRRLRVRLRQLLHKYDGRRCRLVDDG
jgi:hypothetical protein